MIIEEEQNRREEGDGDGEERGARQQVKCPISDNWREVVDKFTRIQRSFIDGDENAKAIVWVCDSRHICGGFGDRVRGIVTTFLIALVTERAFFIDSLLPEPLSHYFQFDNSEEITWDYWRVFNDSRLIERRSVIEENVVDQIYSQEPRYLTADLKQSVKEDIWYIRSNVQLHEAIMFNPHYKDLLIRSLQLNISHVDNRPADVDIQQKRNNFEGGAILSGCVINYVLSPTPRLQKLVNATKTRLNGEEINHPKKRNTIVIGIQVRVGDAGWKSKGSLQQDLFDDPKFSYYWKCATAIESLVVSAKSFSVDPEFKWFLTCDSSDLIQQVQRQFGHKVFVVEGGAAHIEKSRNAKEELESVYVQQLLLSEVDYLIISRSQFGKIASHRGFLPAFVNPNDCSSLSYAKLPH
eukprot:TRINITY_DN11136_c0_g1_i1.p1 TRINITY_DN11136_c0_g1~~TRINITY_DN11136_c0_g1_i1.p1  ORF type:complete len:417 (-),score=76.03 TRINITY_DN11136_c0_g1_i1:33-1259(-)